MSDFKTHLAQSYDNDSNRRAANQLPEWKIEVRQRFMERLIAENKKSLLEIGAGTGIDGVYFQGNGLDVTCIDLSPESVKKCTERGLSAKVMDFYSLSFSDDRFEAIYALNCLLHVPKKDMDQVMEEIKRVLVTDGLLYLGLYGGKDSEGVWEEDWCEPKRFFSFYLDDAILEVVSRHFEIEHFSTIPLEEGNPHFQSFTLRKR